MTRFTEVTGSLVAVARNRAMRRVLMAFMVFNASEWATWIAMLVFAFERGGAGEAGLVALIQLVPSIFVAPFGSILGDRIPRDRALGLGYLAQGVSTGATAAALALHAPIGLTYSLAAVAAASMTLTRPVHHSILPELADTPQELVAANSASGTAEGLSVFLGPIAAGVLLAVADPWVVYATMALLLSIAGAATIDLPRHAVPRPNLEPGGVVAGAVEGWRAMRVEPGASMLTLLIGATNVMVGMLDVLSVVLAFQVYSMGASGPGVLTAAAGAGALFGGAASAMLVGRRRLSNALFWGTLGAGIPICLISISPTAVIAMLLLVCSGAAKAFSDVAGRTLLQRSVEEDVLARVLGLQEATMMVGLALGSIAAPAVVALFGPRGSLVAAGLLLPAIVLIALPPIRRTDLSASPPGPGLELLRAIPLFRPLAPQVIERLSRDLVPLEALAGSVIIRQGDEGDRFYVVRDGELDVRLDGRSVARHRAGGFFGEIALLRDVPRTASVVAITDAHLFGLSREEFLAAVTGSRRATHLADTVVDQRLDENRGS